MKRFTEIFSNAIILLDFLLKTAVFTLEPLHKLHRCHCIKHYLD